MKRILILLLLTFTSSFCSEVYKKESPMQKSHLAHVKPKLKQHQMENIVDNNHICRTIIDAFFTGKDVQDGVTKIKDYFPKDSALYNALSKIINSEDIDIGTVFKDLKAKQDQISITHAQVKSKSKSKTKNMRNLYKYKCTYRHNENKLVIFLDENDKIVNIKTKSFNLNSFAHNKTGKRKKHETHEQKSELNN